MHLHYLRELSDRFEIAAICDLSAETRDAVAREYAVASQFESWQQLIAQPLDAVLILTSGSHAHRRDMALLGARNIRKSILPACGYADVDQGDDTFGGIAALLRSTMLLGDAAVKYEHAPRPSMGLAANAIVYRCAGLCPMK